MPRPISHPCKHPGCRALVSDRSPYCERHRKEHVWSAAERRATGGHNYGSNWRATRERILRRDDGLCQVCLKHGRITPASEVDHITPRAQNGSDCDENLQSICPSCHREKTAYEARKGQGRGKSSRG